MKFRKYVIALIFIVMIVSVGAVSAAEVNSTDDAGDSVLATDDSGVVKYYVDSNAAISGNGSESSPYKTIGEAISGINAVNGTEIHLADGVYSSAGDRNFYISSVGNLSILGSGENTIIDLSNSGYFINAYDYNSNVVMKDLTINHGWTNYNTLFVNMGSLTLENVNIYNSRSPINNNGKATISNCKFINNTGTVTLYNEVHVTDSTFINNVANGYGNGGALYCGGSVAEVINSTFIDNRHPNQRSGAAIFASGKLNVTNSNFTNNVATSTGGAIYCSNSYVTGCTFTLNKGSTGGAIGGSTAIIENCNFINNTATENGGAIYIQNGIIENNKFINNSAYVSGAAIYAQGAPSLKNNTVENCASRKDNFVYFTSLSILKGLTYVVLDNSSSTIESVNIRLNASVFDDDGNPISGSSVTFLMNDEVVGTADSTFGTASLSFNKILNGTYIVSVKLPNDECIVKTATLSISPLENIDVYVSPDGDDENGDGSKNNPYKSIEKGLTEATKAINGNLYVKNGVYNITKSFDVDAAGNFSIIAYEGNVTFDMGNNNCFATVKGNVSIYNVTFINGYSTSTSTLRSLFSGETLKLVGCSFINNNCYQYLLGVNYVDIDSCYFMGNRAQAVIYGAGGKITNSYINDKKGISYTIYSSGRNLIIDKCEFDSVYIQIYSNTPLTKITDSKFYNNLGSYNVIQSGGKIEVDNCTFVGQSRNSIRINDNNANITNCKFINNTGTITYAPIYYNGYSSDRPLYLNNNMVINSTSEYYVYLQGYISSPYTYVVLGNESIDIESYGYKFTAIGYDDALNKINFAGVNFLLNGTSIGSASYDKDGAYLDYKKVLDGTYTVSVKSNYIDDDLIKTATLKIAPLNVEVWVSNDGDDENDGSQAHPLKTIEKAVTYPAYISTIHICEGTYEIADQLMLGSGENCYSFIGAGIDKTIIDLKEEHRFINNNYRGTVNITNMTISNGYSGSGGAIYNGGTLNINSVSFINSICDYGYGGAILNYDGDMSIIGSNFINSISEGGCGGAVCNYGGTSRIINSTFVDSLSGEGGAIYNEDGYLYLKNNTIIDPDDYSIVSYGTIDGVTLIFNDNETSEITTIPTTLKASINANGVPISGSVSIIFTVNGNNLGTASINDEGVATLSSNKKYNGEYILTGGINGATDLDIKTATLNYNIPGFLNDVWVSKEGNDESGNGSRDNPYATIEKALTKIYDGGSTIHVLKGNYVFNQRITISQFVTIVGEEEDVVFDGSMSKFLYIETLSGLTIKNVTFANGKSNQMIDNRGSLTIDNCIFENNTGNSYQFLIYSYEGELNLLNSIFRNNVVPLSGSSAGVLIWQNGESKIVNTTFYNNTANAQSALIYIGNGQHYDSSWRSYWTDYGASIENCRFIDNLGSILSLDYIDIPIIDSVFSNNTGKYLIYLSGSSTAKNRVLNISNSRFTDNTVDEGIVEMQRYIAVIQNNIFANNTGCIGFSSGYNNHEFIIGNNVISNNSNNDYGNYLYINNYATITGSNLKLIFNNNASYVVEGFELPLNVTLVDENGNQISGIYVTFSLNGANAGQVRIVNGVAENSKFVSANGNYTVSGTPQIANTNIVEILNAVFEVKLQDSKVIYVDVFGDDTTGDGSEDNPYASLSRAFEDINAINTTIYIKPGVYSGELNYDKELNIPGGAYVEIVGLSEFGDNVVFKDLSNRFLGFMIQGASSINDKVNFAVKNIIFEDSTFDNGFVTGNNYVGVLIDNITFINATPRQLVAGGNNGFYITVSNVDIDFNNAVFTDSAPFMSSTLPNGNGGALKLINSSFKNGNFENSQYFIYAGSIEIINSTFSNISMRMSGMSYLVYSYFGLNIDNSTFINNSANSIIDQSAREGCINNSVFDSNMVTGGFFISNSGILTISNCAILNVTSYNGNAYLFGRGSGAIPLNDNWFGNNNLTLNPGVKLNMAVDNWVIADVTPNELPIKENSTITVKFLSNDGSELENVLPARVVEAVADSAIFENGQNNISYTINGNEVSFTVLPDAFGTVNLTIDNQEFTLNIVKANSTVLLDVFDTTTVDGLTAVATVNDDATGEVVFTLSNGESYTVNIINGAATLFLDTISSGDYNITAVYGGDDLYNGNEASASFKVTDIIVSAADVKFAYKDPNAELVAVVTDENGNPLVVNLNVEFNGENSTVTTDADGQAIIPIGNLTPGKYNAVISYQGSSKTASANALVTVTKAATSISADDVNIAYKDPNGEIVATIISEHGKGLAVNLNVELNGKTYTVRTDSNGQAVIPVGNLTPGKYNAKISYKGSSNYKASSATVLVTVTKAATSIDAGDVNIAYRDPTGELVATVTNEHGKTLIVTLNIELKGKTYSVRTDSNGQAVLSLYDVTPGTYDAVISYKGSSNYKGFTTTAKVVVTKAATSIDAGDVNIAYRDPTGELVATVTNEHGKTLIVTVNIELNGKTYSVRTDANGQAVLSLYDVTPGTYDAKISYKGSNNYQGFTTTAKVVVTKAATSIDAGDVNIAYRDPTGELVATVTNEHGKTLIVTVNIELNGKTYSVRTDANGQAVLSLYNVTPGTYNAKISYKGSNNYQGFTTTAKVVVTKSDTIISAPDVSVASGDPDGKLVSTIVNEHGKPLVVTMKVELDGKTYSARSDSNGQINVSTADLAPGSYVAKISYKGSSNYNSASTTANITVKP